jgi:hypothetical protein
MLGCPRFFSGSHPEVGDGQVSNFSWSRIMSNNLGEVVGWSVDTKGTVVHDVRQALATAGFEPDAAKDLNAKHAWGRAIKSLKESRSIDKLVDEDGSISFQFTRKAVLGGRFEFDYEFTVHLDATTGNVTCPERPDFAIEAQNLVNAAYNDRNASDISRIVMRLFKKRADLFPIIPDKGVVYFVPHQHKEFTDRIETFLSAMGGKLHRFIVPKGDEKSNREVRDSVMAGMEEMIQELSASVDGWDDTTRTDTINRALDRYQKIRLKMDAYAEFLSDKSGEIRTRLDDARKQFLAKVEEFSAAK